jgi:hypothetical protein
MMSSAAPSSSLQRALAGDEAGEGEAEAMGVTGAEAERVAEGVASVALSTVESMAGCEMSASQTRSEREEAKQRFEHRAEVGRSHTAPFDLSASCCCSWIT